MYRKCAQLLGNAFNDTYAIDLLHSQKCQPPGGVYWNSAAWCVIVEYDAMRKLYSILGLILIRHKINDLFKVYEFVCTSIEGI